MQLADRPTNQRATLCVRGGCVAPLEKRRILQAQNVTAGSGWGSGDAAAEVWRLREGQAEEAQ